jgi:hypothetical protein
MGFKPLDANKHYLETHSCQDIVQWFDIIARTTVAVWKEGELGVLNLAIQNGALLHKYMCKFFNEIDLP